MDPRDDPFDPGAQARAKALRRLAREQLGLDPEVADPPARSRSPAGVWLLALSGILALAVIIGLLVWVPRPRLHLPAIPPPAGGACLPKAGATIPNVRVSHDTF